MQESMGVTDQVTAVLGKVTEKPGIPLGPMVPTLQGSGPVEPVRVQGFVEVRLFGPDGKLKYYEEGVNLVTDQGDQHIARRIFDDAFNIVTGMRLGTGVTAAAKAGAGGAIVTYITGSQELLDAAATHSDLGAGLGYRATHICTWIAGDVTNAAIAETVLTDETPLTDVAGVLANTVARFVFASTIDKQAGDSLEVTWNLDILGA